MVILEIAKQKLVQKPCIMLCSWKKCLSTLKTLSEFNTVFNIDDYCRQILPTNKNVIKLIQSEPTNGNEREPFLWKCLKYCTGSDIILVDTIAVEFIACLTVARRPIVHTCGPMWNSHLLMPAIVNLERKCKIFEMLMIII